MPIVHLRINIPLDGERKKEVLQGISQWVADVMRKPISDIMVISSQDDLIMGDQFGPAAFVDIKCISGLTVAVSRKICEGLSHLLKKAAGIDSSRIYVNFTEVSHVHAWRFVGGEAVCPKDAL